MRSVLCLSLIIYGITVPGLAQQRPPTAIPVGTVVAERKAIAQTYDFVGRVEAVNRVQINARVKGFLEAVLFKEGHAKFEERWMQRPRGSSRHSVLSIGRRKLSIKT